MSIRKKILAISIGPVLVLGVITLLFMLTMVKSSLMDEVQDALKGTAAATLAAYDQNTGDYLESTRPLRIRPKTLMRSKHRLLL